MTSTGKIFFDLNIQYDSGQKFKIYDTKMCSIISLVVYINLTHHCLKGTFFQFVKISFKKEEIIEKFPMTAYESVDDERAYLTLYLKS